jgi:signal transduction histidine kinase
LEHFLTWLVVAYSTAAHTSGRRRVAGLAIAVAAGATYSVASLASGHPSGTVLPGMLFCTVAWMFGSASQRHELLARVLRERADQLEREARMRAQADVTSERTRIARELHDVVAHSVSVMVIQAQAGQRQLSEPEQVAATLGSIEGSGREALVELRRMVAMLRSDEHERMLGPQPGLGALDALVAQVADAGLRVTVRVQGRRVPLPAGVDLSAYRILQEALTNTIKHAGDTETEILLGYSSAALEIEVLDRGCRPAVSANGGGHGLIGMRERVALLGGSLEAAPREDGGYRVWARLPLTDQVG